MRGTPPDTACTRSNAFGVNDTDVDPRATHRRCVTYASTSSRVSAFSEQRIEMR